jgi:3-methyladenine DNA glycosylase/8-oxoguanine DNA glycosylase
MSLREVPAIDASMSSSFTLRPRAPFHFGATVRKPSNFSAPCVDHEPGQYWQTMRWQDRVLGIRMSEAGRTTRPEVEVTVFSDEVLPAGFADGLARELRWRFDLDADLSEFGRQLGDDPVLAGPISRWTGMRVSSPYSLYEFLVVTTVLQNTTVRRTVAMLRALFEQYGSTVRFDGRELFAFWLPPVLSAAGQQELRDLKVGYRAKTLVRVASIFAADDVDEFEMRGLNRESAQRALLRLYGIGPASVWYLLFSQFHHYDAFDVISPWEQRIYSRLLFDEELVPGDRVLQEVRSRWGAWRMLAAMYLFEDLFWQHREQPIAWLSDLIRT